MQARKIIKGYTVIADVDLPKTEALDQKAFFTIQFARGDSVFSLNKLLASSPNVLDIWGVAGKWDCFVLTRASDLHETAKLREYIFGNVKLKQLETRPVLNEFSQGSRK